MKNNGIILLVEDNEKLNDANSRSLKLSDYEVHAALNLNEARKILSQTEPDVILLDVMLPDGNGFDFCAEIRGGTHAHILFLTAKAEHEDMIQGLKTGGDDYLMKPFHPNTLTAKIEAAMRRRAMDKTPAKIFSVGNLMLDFISSQAFVEGFNLRLKTKEFLLLRLLTENENNLMTTETLYEEVWKEPMAGYDRTLRKHMSELRSKLADHGCNYTVNAVYGKGYCFEKKRM